MICDLSKLSPEQRRVSPDAIGVPYDHWLFRQPLCTPQELQAWIKAHTPDTSFTPAPVVEEDPQGGLF